jgi:outer membrane protein assembly factor BamD
MKKIILLFVLSLSIFSCSEFSKTMKSEDNEYKKTEAVKYYENEEYLNAVTLLEDIIPFYKLSVEGEKLYYYYCMGNYNLGDYYIAAYYFRRFINQYPSSKYTEECQFLSAMCSVHNSPEPSLDQTETLNALDQLQIFVDMYPNSEKMDTCNQIMDRLHSKLETKQFESSKLYYHTENYKASVVSFENILVKYPNSQFKEEVSYYIVMSRYELAINSIQSKKLERLYDTMKSYRKFADEFPNSTRLKEMEGVENKTQQEIDLIEK